MLELWFHFVFLWLNAWRTLAAGVLLWAVYIGTGSILPGMVLHALIDIRRAFTEPAPIAAPAA